MASLAGNKANDLWAEIASEEDQQPKPLVVYGRRRVEETSLPNDAQIDVSDRDRRASFAPGKRTSWNRSLSTRGRESIVVAPGVILSHRRKQKGPRKRPPRPKKAAEVTLDFTKEKAYFEEVDAFELPEESPSPKNAGTWTMGVQHDQVVHDLASILERWKLSKSQPVSYLETPDIPSIQSTNYSVGCSNERTPERAQALRMPLSFSSCERSATTVAAGRNTLAAIHESSIITTLDGLTIKEEDIEDFESLTVGDAEKELEGGIKKAPFDPRSVSLGQGRLSAFAQILMICRQSAPVTLSEVFSEYCESSSIMKLGEGTYGEAFRAGSSVCKIVPIDGNLLVNGEVQKKSEEVLDEVLLSLTLNSLRAQQGEVNKHNACTSFIETKEFRVCRGAYDAGLISAWEDWDTKHGSENDHPKGFPEDQLYLVFVLGDGGKDLESFVLLDFGEARSLLIQVTAALAVAEAACEFEHRDLHWGNILLARTEATELDFTLQGRKLKVKTFGLSISIIDFTLSRINTGEAILFLDLSADPEIFEGPKGDIQFETYRKMKKVTEECWEGSFPKTNILWLMYLVDILLTKKSFKQKLTTKHERELRSFKKRLVSYGSAQDSLDDNFFSDLLIDHSM